MKKVDIVTPIWPGRDVESAPSEMPKTEKDRMSQDIKEIADLKPEEIEAIKMFRKYGIMKMEDYQQILNKEAKKKIKSTKISNQKYDRGTAVACTLDHQAESLHKKLRLNKSHQEREALLKETNLDKLAESGMVKTIVSRRQRRREIDKNNTKLLNAL